MRIPKEDKAEIQALSAELKVDMSELVRLALRFFVNNKRLAKGLLRGDNGK